MYSQINLPKSSFSNFLNKFIKVQASLRELLIDSCVLSNVTDNFISFEHYFIIKLLVLLFLKMLLLLVNPPRKWFWTGIYGIFNSIKWISWSTWPRSMLPRVAIAILILSVIHSKCLHISLGCAHSTELVDLPAYIVILVHISSILIFMVTLHILKFVVIYLLLFVCHLINCLIVISIIRIISWLILLIRWFWKFIILLKHK